MVHQLTNKGALGSWPRTLWILGFFFAMAILTAPAEEPSKTVRLLTIGNSFAGNATAYLSPLAKATGRQVILGEANPAACSLEKHWKNLEAALADPTAGKIYQQEFRGGPKRSLPEYFEGKTWDYVSIQQLSGLSTDPTTFQPYADRLSQFIKEKAPGAKIIIMQTWAYRHDHARFKIKGSSQEMHLAVRKAYQAIAEGLGLSIVPVGEAFALANETPEWTYRPDPDFDFDTPTFPQLPKQPGSLYVGWFWFQPKDAPKKLLLDGYHANIYGKYLGSCVYFEFLFGESSVGNPFVPSGITPEQARSLQEIAHQAIQNSQSAKITQLP